MATVCSAQPSVPALLLCCLRLVELGVGSWKGVVMAVMGPPAACGKSEATLKLVEAGWDAQLVVNAVACVFCWWWLLVGHGVALYTDDREGVFGGVWG